MMWLEYLGDDQMVRRDGLVRAEHDSRGKGYGFLYTHAVDLCTTQSLTVVTRVKHG